MAAHAAEAIIVPALKKHTATVIIAHGLGDSGKGWAFLAENWRRRNKFEEVEFIFPNAPDIPITVNFGMRMPGWYDIKSFDSLQSREDEPGVLRTQSYFHNLINTQVSAGIPSERIVLGGFSQGGAVSLFSGLTSAHKLGGIFGLSCYLLLHSKLQSLLPPGNPNKETKIFMGHGNEDQVVQYQWGSMSAERLKQWGYSVDFHTYPGLPHSASEDEIDDLEKWLNQRIPPLGGGKDEDKSEL